MLYMLVIVHFSLKIWVKGVIPDIVQKNSVLWLKSWLDRGKHIKKCRKFCLKRNGTTFCGLMKATFFLGLGAADTLSPPNTEFKPQFTVKTVKHGGTSITIKGCFSYHGVRPIYHTPGIVDQFEYIRILEEVILPNAENEMPLKCVLSRQTPNTPVREQQLGSRPTILRLWSGKPIPQTIIQ